MARGGARLRHVRKEGEKLMSCSLVLYIKIAKPQTADSLVNSLKEV